MIIDENRSLMKVKSTVYFYKYFFLYSNKVTFKFIKVLSFSVSVKY